MGAYDDLGATPVVEESPTAPPDYSDLGGTPAGDPEKELKMGNAHNVLKANLAASKETATVSTAPKPDPTTAHTSDSFVEDFLAGWGVSSLGTYINKNKQDYVLPEHAGRAARILSMAGTVAGDMPLMLAGMIGGEVVAGPLGGSAAAFALPAAIRKTLVDHYEKGDIKNFGDFYDRASATFLTTLKAGTVGLVTGGAGIAAKGAFAAASPLVAKAGISAAEVSAMTATGSILEGHVPNLQDFADNAILIAGMHTVGIPAKAITKSVQPKLMKIWAETGMKPNEVLDLAKQDPSVHEELLSKNTEIPASIVDINPNPEITGKTPGGTATSLKDEAQTPEVSEAVKAVRADKNSSVPVVDGKKFTFREFYKDYIDKLDPISEAMKELKQNPHSTKVVENAYKLARMSGGYRGKASYSIIEGNMDFETLAKNGKGLKEIVGQVEDAQHFDDYLFSRNILEKSALGEKVDETLLSHAQEVVGETGGKFDKVEKEFNEWRNKNLEYLRDSGRISQEKFEESKINKEFPLSSEGKSKSPLQSSVEEVQHIMKEAEKNRATAALIKTAEGVEGQEVLKKVEFPRGELSKNQFEYFRDGKREVWATKDSNLAEAIKSMDGDIPSQNFFMKLAAGVTTFKKIQITGQLDFIFNNFGKDQITSSVLTQGKYSISEVFQAMGDILNKREVYYDYLKSGGAGASMLEIDKNYIKTDIFKINDETNFLNATRNLVLKPKHVIEAAGSLLEESTRLAEMKRLAKGASSGPLLLEGGFGSRESTVDFSRVGAKISAFNRIIAFLNPSIQGTDRTVRAFVENPKKAGTNVLKYVVTPSIMLWWATHDDERVKETPRHVKDLNWLIPVNDWVKSTEEGAAGFPKHLVRRDDKGNVEINNGTLLRIRKPELIGLAGSLAERTLEGLFAANPKAFKEFDETMLGFFKPNVMPDILLPAVEHAFNESMHTGGPLVPYAVENVLPQEQYTQYTSESAKQIAKLVSLVPFASNGKHPLSSPIVVENYIKSWTGPTGGYALSLADKALTAAGVVPPKVKPEDTLADIPFIKSFVIRYPSTGAQSIQDFYENFNKHDQMTQTIAHLRAVGNYKQIGELLKDPENVERLTSLSGIKSSLSNQAALARKIYDNPDYSRDDKRQLMDKIYYGMIETAKAGNKMVEAIENSENKK